MKGNFTFGGLVLIASAAASPILAAPAQFWLSPSSIAPSGPETPNVPSVTGATRFLHIWGQPATVDPDLPYDEIANPFKQLRNYSLNVVTLDATINFLDDAITVYNPEVTPGVPRFEQIAAAETPFTAFDSTTGFPADAVTVQGFTLDQVGSFEGVGPTCEGDPLCASTPDGSPAWLLASVPYQVTSETGQGSMFLQVGYNGLTHANEESSLTNVRFGFEADALPIYNASSNRNLNLPGDDPDLVAPAVSPSAVPTLNWNGGSGLWSDQNWSVPAAVPSSADNAVLNSGVADVVTIAGSQFANQTSVAQGRLQLGTDAYLGSPVDVSPAGSISGSGWIGADLTLAGTLAIDDAAPLRVVGQAHISGASLGVTGSFELPPGETDQFTVLESLNGVTGNFSTPVGEIAPGVLLEEIIYTGNRVDVRLTSTLAPGGFLMDGQLDTAAEEVATNGGFHLYASREGDALYIATEDSGEGNDVFIYVALDPGPLTNANWGKSGQVAQWDAFLADENDNDFAGWFDATGNFDPSGENRSAKSTGTGVLEGVLDLVDEFGTVPDQVYLAVGRFETSDNGALLPSLQVPASNDGNGNLDEVEFFLLTLANQLPGDYNGDGFVNLADYTVWRDNLGAMAGTLLNDVHDGPIGPLQYTTWKDNFGNTLPPSGATGNSSVPEPRALVLAVLFGMGVAWGARRV